jgi:hypothetical protein
MIGLAAYVFGGLGRQLAATVAAFGALAQGGMPRWLAGFGLLSAVLLAGLALPVFRGPELVPVPVPVAVSLSSAWMIAADASAAVLLAAV